MYNFRDTMEPNNMEALCPTRFHADFHLQIVQIHARSAQ